MIIILKHKEKPFPKKSPTLVSFLNIKPVGHGQTHSNEKVNSNSTKKAEIENEFDSKCSTSIDKVTIKDLCPEDKKRIANLIKELAK